MGKSEGAAKGILLFGPSLGVLMLLADILPRLDVRDLALVMGVLISLVSSILLLGPLVYYLVEDRRADAKERIAAASKGKSPKVTFR